MKVTAVVATRDRPGPLATCLRSMALAGDLVAEVIVVDDGSQPPAAPGAAGRPPVRVLRHDTARGAAAARNKGLRAASTPYVLFLDDDAFLLDASALRQATDVLDADPEVAVVALAQADASGRPHPPQTQPAPVEVACYVPAFVGYGHVVRREPVLDAGGYRDQLGINGEEKELCLRLLDRGLRVVYLPTARVAHVPAAAGRDLRRYLHQTVRNTALSAVYNEPFPLVVGGVAVRILRYFPMRRGWRVQDPGGFARVLRDLAACLPEALRQRRPVRWATVRRWREMTQAPPQPYVPASSASTATARSTEKRDS